MSPLARHVWRKQQSCCMVPGCTVRDGLHTHEICGGSDRHKTVHLPPFWLALCPAHHEALGSRPNQESLIEQLKWKRDADEENYDPEAVIRMWRPLCTAAFVKEIIEEVEA